MCYYCDMSAISLDKLKDNLHSQRLLPSQKIFLEDIEGNFGKIKKLGINDLKALFNILKNKDKIKELADRTGIDIKYLTVLKREVSSYHPVSRKIADFSKISDDIKQKLLAMGIKTTKHLFTYVATKAAIKKLVADIGISQDDALMLAKLCDVSRLRYVNCDFAQLLVRSKYDTVEKIKTADYMKLYEELKALNEGNRYYTGHIGPKDMEFLVRDKPNADVVMEF